MTPPERPCSRCRQRPAPRGQRWCRECSNGYRRTWRQKRRSASVVEPYARTPRKGTGENGAENVVPDAAVRQRPVFVPFAGNDTPPREPWYVPFLSHLAANGGMALAAAHVGISRGALKRVVATDPDFAEEVEAARGFYAELVEWESVNLARTRNNPLPFFARLKAEMPDRYIDRQAILSVTTNVDVTPEQAKQLLAAAFGHITDTTRRMIEGHRIIVPAASVASAESPSD